jgi:BioD-like phosphotransacetylase family protein
MPTTLIARFATRRDAEMTIEQLVQTLGIDRTMVFVAAAEAANSAGVEPDGSDLVEGQPDPDANPALEGLIEVSVDLEDEDTVDAAEAVFRDHGAEEVDRR